MAITICDHNLGLLGMVLLPSEFDPLNNKNPFAPPTDHDICCVCQQGQIIKGYLIVKGK